MYVLRILQIKMWNIKPLFQGPVVIQSQSCESFGLFQQVSDNH